MTHHEAKPPQPNDTVRRAVALAVLLAMVIVVVRAGASVCMGQFTTTAAGEITDAETQLVWSTTTHGPSIWSTANGNCTSPWRLPTALELQTIIDDETSYFPAPFPDAGTGLAYWSSSPPGNTSSKFFVGSNGGVNKDDTGNKHRYRCVRFGP